jgi:pimeloyl-ACP methyl ester carboxylesterase
MNQFETRFFTAEDGLRLHARDYPAAHSPATGSDRLPVFCLPGLSRNARDFHAFALLVSQHEAAPRRVVSLDYRGRGLSARDENAGNYNLAVECRDVLTVLAALGITSAIFVGTSRGGLILHVMAASNPELIAAAVLNDIGPVIEAAGLMEIRDYLCKRAEPADLDAAAKALAALHGPTFPALTPADWRDMAEALYAVRDGRLVADHDPALADQLRAVDFDEPLPTLWPQFEILAKRPLLVVRGEHSRLLSRETVDRMISSAATVTAVTAPGQGHTPLLHHPDVYPTLKAFLAGLAV